jgi:hypothetical protein
VAGGFPFKVLGEHVQTTSGYACIGTMHLAKGLEIRAVAVMACGDEVIPPQQPIETVGDDADLKEIYETGVISFTLPVPVRGITCWLRA